MVPHRRREAKQQSIHTPSLYMSMFRPWRKWRAFYESRDFTMIYFFKQAFYIYRSLAFTTLCRSSAVYELIIWELLLSDLSAVLLGEKKNFASHGEPVPCPAPHLGQPFSSSSFTLDRLWLNICRHLAKISLLLFNMTHPFGSWWKPLLPIAMCMRSDEHRSAWCWPHLIGEGAIYYAPLYGELLLCFLELMDLVG